MRAIGYLRVSTDDQSLGIEAQEATIREWAARKGWELEALFTDKGISGAAPIEKRPGLTAALAALKRGSILVAAKRDRFARDPGIMIMLDRWVKQARCKMISCDGVGADEGPTGELMAGMIDMFSRFERRLIGARTSAALKALRAKGGKAGGHAPYGWQIVGAVLTRQKKDDKDIMVWVGGDVVPHPEEQAALAFARELRAAGVPLRGIVAELEAGGHPPRGRKWHLTSVARMLAVDTGGGVCTD